MFERFFLWTRRKSLLIISLEKNLEKTRQEVTQLTDELKRSRRDNETLKEMLIYTEENHTVFERSRWDNETLKGILIRTNQNHTAFESSLIKVLMECVRKESMRAERIIAEKKELERRQTDFATEIGLFPESKNQS